MNKNSMLFVGLALGDKSSAANVRHYYKLN